MGSSSKTVKDLQIVPVMEEYNDLDKTLLLYDAQNISNGMGAVLEARKHTMFTMKTTMNDNLMKNLGFDTTTTAALKRVDNDLVLFDLQDKYGEDVNRIISSDIGLATIEEMGHMLLQDIYPDYTVDGREFLHNDGFIYRYAVGVEIGGGLIEAECYKRPTSDDLKADLGASYDKLDILSFSDYPIETSSGIYEIEISFNYIEYTVTITVDDGNTIEESSYVTTTLNGVESGTVIDNGVITTTTIVKLIKTAVEYVPIELLYIQGSNTSYGFIFTIEDEHEGTHTGLSVGGYKHVEQQWSGSSPVATYGLGTPPSTDWRDLGEYEDNPFGPVEYSEINITYSSDVNIVPISTTEVDIIINSITIDNPEYISLEESIVDWEKARIGALIHETYKELYEGIVVIFEKEGNQHIEIIDGVTAQGCLVDTPMSVLPIIPLKIGRSFVSDRNTRVALRDMGMVGDEFNKSLRDKEVRYASLGFMVDVDDDSDSVTRLMYHTLEHLASEGQSLFGASGRGKGKEDTEVSEYEPRGFKIEFEGMVVTLTANFKTEVKWGTIGDVATYTKSTEPYTATYTKTSGFETTTRSEERLRRIYRRQENKYYYTEITLESFTVNHSYRGTSSYTTRKNSSHDGMILRIPIIREVVRKLPFIDYVYILQMSMVLSVYTKVTIKTKWYQSGIFSFIMAAVAVGIVVVTAGSGTAALGAIFAGDATMATVLTAVAFIGAVAGAILAVAGVVGVDLGVVGDVLQVLAVLGAVAALTSSTLNYMNELSKQAATVTTTAKASSEVAAQGILESSNQASNGLWVDLKRMFDDIVFQGDLAANGFIETGTELLSPTVKSTQDVINTAASNMSSGLPKLPIVNGPYTPVPQPPQPATPLQLVNKGLGLAGKAAKIINDIDGMFEQRKLANMHKDLIALTEKAELAKKELEELEQSRGQALMLAPNEIENYVDRLCSIPDPYAGMGDLHAQLVTNINVDTSTVMWN